MSRKSPDAKEGRTRKLNEQKEVKRIINNVGIKAVEIVPGKQTNKTQSEGTI